MSDGPGPDVHPTHPPRNQLAGTPTGAAEEHRVIDLVCPALADHLPILRAVATSVALRADADLDTVADLRIAVDEACSSLIRSADLGASLRCRFSRTPDAVRVEGTVRSHRPGVVDDPLGVLLIQALTDEASTDSRPVEDAYEVTVSLLVRTPPLNATAGAVP